jgi:hypothetical protein
MLPATIEVLLARQGFPDAQVAMLGAQKLVGFFHASWYGTNTDDERGCFAVVDELGPLTNYVGDFVYVSNGKRGVYVYVIGSKRALLSDIALTRRAFMAISLLAVDPIYAKVSVVQ